MMEKNDIQRELKELNSSLWKHKEAKGYKVPDGYFSEFQSRMTDQLLGNEEVVEESNFLRWLDRFFAPKVRLALVASMVICIGTYLLLSTGGQPNDSFANQLDELTAEDMELFIDEYSGSITEDMMAVSLDDQAFDFQVITIEDEDIDLLYDEFDLEEDILIEDNLM